MAEKAPHTGKPVADTLGTNAAEDLRAEPAIWIINTAADTDTWRPAIQRMRDAGSRREFTIKNVITEFGVSTLAVGVPLLIAQTRIAAPDVKQNRVAQTAPSPDSPTIELVGYAKLTQEPVFKTLKNNKEEKALMAVDLNLRMERVFSQPVSQADLDSALPLLSPAIQNSALTPVNEEEWGTLREVILSRDSEIQDSLPLSNIPVTVAVALIDVELPGPWTVNEKRRPTLQLKNTGNARLPAGFSFNLESNWRGILYKDITHQTNQMVYVNAHIAPGEEFVLVADPIILPSYASRYDVTWTLLSQTILSGSTHFETTYDVQSLYPEISEIPTAQGDPRDPSITAPVWLINASEDDSAWKNALNNLSQKGIKRSFKISGQVQASFLPALQDILVVVDDKQAMIGLGRIGEVERRGLPLEIEPALSFSVEEQPKMPELTLSIQLTSLFDQPLTRSEVDLALPDLSRPKTPNFLVPVANPDWNVLRELILFKDPDLNDSLPASTFTPIHQIEILEIDLPKPWEAGSERLVNVQLRNTGSVRLFPSSPYKIESIWKPKTGSAINVSYPLASDYVVQTVPPGGYFVINSVPVALPTQAGAYDVEWTISVPGLQLTSPPYPTTYKLAPKKAPATTEQNTLAANQLDRQDNAAANQLDRQDNAAVNQRDRPAEQTVQPAETNMANEPTKPPEQVKQTVESSPGPEISEKMMQIIYAQAPDVTLQIVTALQPLPAPAPGRLVIEINPKEIRLYDGNSTVPYKSENRLDHKKLQNPEQLSAQGYGELLFRGLINPHNLVDAKSTQDGHRLVTAAGANDLPIELRPSPLHPQYKWEYLVEPEAAEKGRLPPALLGEAPLCRRHFGVEAGAVSAAPLRILFAVCNPIDLGKEFLPSGEKVHEKVYRLDPLSVADEQQVFEKAMQSLQEAGKAPLAEYKILSPDDQAVTLDALAKSIQGYRPHILHLLAHGVYQEVRQEVSLVMEDINHLHDFIYAEDLDAVILGGDLRLVVLASCQAGNLARSEWQHAFAPRLLKKVPAVIAMQDDMPVGANQVFTQSFYNELGRSGRIDQAMAVSRHVLYRQDKSAWTWGIPVLAMSTSDGKLFEIDQTLAGGYAPLDHENLETQGQVPLSSSQGEAKASLAAADIQRSLQRYGFEPDSSLAAAIRAAAAPVLARNPPETEAPFTGQDRTDLDGLNRGFQLDAREMQRWVERTARLTLNKSIYDQLAAALNAGKHIILIGPHGTGKTSLCQAVCEYAQTKSISKGYILTTATADWTTFDTVGGYMPTSSNELQFRPGIFLKAISAGKWLVIDEINRAEIDKAFGELFTVLSGQGVDLPYNVKDQPITILSSRKVDKELRQARDWIPPGAGDTTFVVHPNWRIIGTMNVYDKSSLFQMSFAFMRRFAFIDFDLPEETFYLNLVYAWMEKNGLPAVLRYDISGEIDHTASIPWEELKPIQKLLRRCLSQGTIVDSTPTVIQSANPLMERRALGPAIIKDLLEFAGARYAQEMKDLQPGQSVDEAAIMLGSFLLYVVPQLDGLDYDGIRLIYQFIDDIFKAEFMVTPEDVLRRIRQLYPHIKRTEWDQRVVPSQAG